MPRAHLIADLEEFARSGQLGPLAIGLSRNQVFALLGAPADWLKEKPVNESAIWKYGDLELYFEGDHLHMIHFDSFEVPVAGGVLQLSPWVLCRGLPLEDLEKALRRATIPFTSTPDRWNPGCMRVVTSAGVSFLIQIEGQAHDLGLCQFGRGAGSHAK